MYINSALAADYWSNGGGNTTSTTYFFAAGTHNIQIDYYENTGGAQIVVNFTLLEGGSGVDLFDGNSWSAYYFPYCNDANFRTPPFNRGIADPVSALDFTFPSDTPQIVRDNNTVTQLNEGVLSPGGGGAPFEEVNNYVLIEAEEAINVAGTGTALNKNWVLDSTYAGYNGSGAMQARPTSPFQDFGTNTSMGPSNIVARLDFVVNFTNTGTYRLYMRGRSASGGDAVHVGLNGSRLTSNSGFSGFSTNYGWPSTNINVSIPTPGTYTINVWFKESGTAIDKIWLGTDTASRPTQWRCDSETSDPTQYWLARYERNITVADPTTLIFNISSEDGHRFYVDGNLVRSRWDWGVRNSSESVVLTPGTHTVRIEYRSHTSSTRYLRLEYVLEGPVFHSDAVANLSSSSGDYDDYYGASVIMEDEVDLTGTTFPTLTW
ncbi:MAG: hypothetical protein K8I82_25170, partial [Anaerolineae bacterium]|nr:hypothetical protein [Anaerolineae bacterium]